MSRHESGIGCGARGQRPGAIRKTPRWSAERRVPFAKGHARRKAWIDKDAPLGAEERPPTGGRAYGLPGAAKNTGADV
jgi:hypothetical protein